MNNRVLFVVWVSLLAIRVLIAAYLPLFGDEAFYWQESRELAISYTDLPPMTAWLIAFGTSIAGDNLLGVRWPFLLLGSLLPWLMRYWALWRLNDADDANRVAFYTMCLPLIGMSGVLALPDVPLTLLMLGAFIALDRAADSNRSRDWLYFGLCLGLAMLTHWRAVVLCCAGLVWLVLSARGRRCMGLRGFWLALLLGLTGVLPILWFNAANDWSALRFQAVDRNPWSFQLSGLWIGFEQLALVTPLLAIALFAALPRAWRQRDRGPFDLMLAAALGIVVVYVVVGVFADNERMRVHWPLPGYLPLLLALPLVFRTWREQMGWRHQVARWALPMAVLGVGFVFALLAITASSLHYQYTATRLLDTGFIGWRQAASATQQLIRQLPEDSVLIADNFLLGAELDFALGGKRRIYVLDHPRNVRHGRQAQLAIWQRDQFGLHRNQWERGLLVVEVHARAPGERLAAWQTLCDQFKTVHWLHEERVGFSDISFMFAEVTPSAARGQGMCRTPVLAHLDFPEPDKALAVGEALLVQGWAIADEVGVSEVAVLLDGRRVGAADVHLLAPHVQQRLPHSTDPDHPQVGFSFSISARLLDAGKHRIEIEVRSRTADDLPRRFGPVELTVR
jgi:Dolichyl-phosphate-mannose-protein mannosyltransferase